MDHSGTAHHARAWRTSAGGSNPGERRPDTYSADTHDRQWRQELDEHPSAAVRELGRVVITSAGTRPLRARPVVWQSDVGEASPVWHALAVTDRFVVSVDLTITEAARMKTYASHVRFSEIPDIQTTSQNVEAGVTFRFGSARVTLPSSSPTAPTTVSPMGRPGPVDAATSHPAS